MTFQPLLPWSIFAVVAGALGLARLVSLRQALWVGERRVRAALRWGGVTLAVLLIIVAATRPVLRAHETRTGTTAAAGANLNVFLAVDRAVDDPQIAGMRADITALIEQYPAARYALVSVASRAVLDWPLSEDVWSLRPTIAALSPYPNASDAAADVNAAAARTVLRAQLIQTAQQYPGSRNVVVYLGSGAPGSRIAQDDFDLAQAPVAGGAVLGYGRSDVIGETELRKIAGHLDVPYQHRDADQPLKLVLPAATDGTGTRAATVKPIELYWLPAMLAAGLLLVEVYLSVREFRRGRIARRDLAR